jgi:hypothetical protein
VELLNFVKELEIMKNVGKHENIINLLGCCTKNGNFCIIEIILLKNKLFPPSIRSNLCNC